MKKNDASLLLGFFVPGLGHAYLGLVARGFAFAAAGPALVFAASRILPEVGVLPMLVVAGIALLGVRVGAMFDSYRLPAERHRPVPTVAVLGIGLAMFGMLQVSTFVIRRDLTQAFKVPSAAMAPSILVGDHVFVDKNVYRKRPPARGEVAVFASPEKPDQDFIKRVVGLPGDTVEVRGGHPSVNGWQVPSCAVGAWSYVEPVDGAPRSGQLFVEYLGESAYLTMYDDQALGTDAQGPYVVKPGEYFVMGDNRDNAYDSRMWWGGAGGGVPLDAFHGRARLVWLSTAPTPKSRTGIDLGGAIVPPAPELQGAVDRCLASRPSQTTPPAAAPR